VTKLLVIMEENHTCSTAQAGMPYLESVAAAYAQVACSNFHGIAHPSLPNYLAYATGSTHGVADDGGPSSRPFTGPSVFDQTLSAGKTSTSYHESMSSNCQPSDANGYVVHHNPWVYGVDSGVHADCLSHDIPLGSTNGGALLSAVKAGTLPVSGFAVPNNQDDAHDGTLAQADNWLKAWLPVIESGPDFSAGHLAIVVTFDEPDPSGPATDPVWTVVIHKGTGPTVVNTGAYNVYSLLRWDEDVAGVSHLGNAAAAGDLRRALGL
jgi:phosphatidylinositol-3-phosphatase